MVLARSTELEAVNTMLSAVGLRAINTLDDVAGEGLTALTILREVSRAVQSIGWHFNTDYDVTFTPNSQGKIEVGANVVRVDQKDGYYTKLDVCQRGDYLYDRKENTDIFTDRILLSRVILLEWTGLPEPARAYVMQRAARIFKDRRRADNKNRQSQPSAEEVQALATLKIMDGDTADNNIFDSGLPLEIINREGFVV